MLSAALQLTPTVFSKRKVLRWHTCKVNFIDFGSVVLQFKILICFLPAEIVILGCFWVGFWPELLKMGYSRENPNRGLRTGDFQWY